MKKLSLVSVILLALCLTCFLANPLCAVAEDVGVTGSRPSVAALLQNPIVGADVPSTQALGSSVAKGLLYCLGVFLFGASIFKRFYSKRKNGAQLEHIQIIAKKSLGPRAHLLIVQVNGANLLLSQSGDNISLISSLPDEAEKSTKVVELTTPVGSLASERSYRDIADSPGLSRINSGGPGRP